MALRHTGILGNTAEGAALCLTELCRVSADHLGPHEHPDVTVDVIAFARTVEGFAAADLERVRRVLATSARRLHDAGAEFFVCPANTAHLALAHPGPDLALPGLHIAAVVARCASILGCSKVGLLGTAATLASPMYPKALGSHGIDTVLPEPDERADVDRIIFSELVRGVFRAASRERYVRIIDALAARGCDAVALVCTEIPLLVSPEDSPLPVLDSTRLLAVAAAEVALGQQDLPAWRGGPLEALVS